MVTDVSSADIETTDASGVRDAYRAWPSLAEAASRVSFRAPAGSLSRVAFLGMGGSASAGDIVAGWLSIAQPISFEVYKGHIPQIDLGGTLAIACSASGDTKETLDMTRTAIKRGASIVTISAGGKLGRLGREHGFPHADVPEPLAPRYVLPFLVFSTIAVITKSFRIPGAQKEVRDAVGAMEAQLKRIDLDVPTTRNESKQLALSVLKTTPKIYGSTVTRGVAIRFKTALNENAKKHAFVDAAPELFHNEIQAWEGGADGFLPIFLRHTREAESERRRMDETVKALREMGVRSIEISGTADSDLGQLMSLVYKLDFASYYAAIDRGYDPLPTKLLDKVKRKS